MARINKHLVFFVSLLFVLGFIFLLVIKKFAPLIGHVAYYCQGLISKNITPIPYYLSLIPFGAVALILVISIFKLIALSVKIKVLEYQLKGGNDNKNKINIIVKKLGLEKKVVTIKSAKHFAFYLGVKHPKIYLSTKLISHLNKKELEAVLLHEQYHLENHDTFTMIIASFVDSLFPFFPLLSDLIKKYRTEREIQADQYAVERMKDTFPLVSALRKLLAFPTANNFAFAAIADHDTLEPRIYSLVNKKYTKRQFRLKHLFITLISTLIFGLSAITPIYAKEIHHQEHDVMMVCADGECINSCTSDNNLNKLYSEIPENKKGVNSSSSSSIYTPVNH